MTQRTRDTEFANLTGGFRRELLAHCYRLLGSVDDAEDVVQETYLRAWRAYSRFEGRSSVRTWLYQIATNASLTALRHRARRQLPAGLGHPAADPKVPPAADPRISWLQPIPDVLVTGEPHDPAAIAVARESLRLALIASLQYLPPRQRAVLLLRDVLAFPAAEVAAILDTTTAAVKSTLQRARVRLAQVAPTPENVTEPHHPPSRALLNRYIVAFENADAQALQRLLRADAALELPPSTTWYTGDACATQAVAALGSPGDWRMIPAAANGQPAAVIYRRGTDGDHHPYGIAVLTTIGSHITRITVFADPTLPARFGPATAASLPTRGQELVDHPGS